MNKEKLDSELRSSDEFFRKNISVNPGRPLVALVVDLANESYEEVRIPQLWVDEYVAGPALAARIWACYAGEQIDSVTDNEKTNPVVIVTSPSAGKGLPMGESLAIAFRSPQTGVLTMNVCSSSFGARLASCGYGAVVLCNRMRRLGVVQIKKEDVSFTLSDRFFGKKVSQSEASVGEDESAIITGPSADSHVLYASAFTEGKMTGRSGLGFVLGMKNVKAVIVHSEIKHSDRSFSSFEKLAKRIEKSPSYELLKRSGTSYLIKSAMAEGWAPIGNYKKRTDPRLFHLSGSEVERKCPSSSSSCYGCLIKCRHNTSEGLHVPGYESLLMLGSNCDCYDLDKVVQRYTLCVELGLDPISTGNVLAYAKKTGRYNVDFSDNNQVLNFMYLISNKTGVGDELGNGAEYLENLYPSDSETFHINGLECGSFDFRGSYVQALNSSMLWWFSNYFGLEIGLTDKNPAFWQVFNEETVMGLESFGFSPSVLLTEIGYLNPVKKRLCSRSGRYAASFFRLEEVADALSDLYDCKLTCREIREEGAKCRHLINLINANLRPLKPQIPPHFRSDPESNSKNSSIVNFNTLYDSYLHERDYSFALLI